MYPHFSYVKIIQNPSSLIITKPGVASAASATSPSALLPLARHHTALDVAAALQGTSLGSSGAAKGLDMDGSWTWVWLAMVDYGSIFFGVDPAISCSIHAISRLFSHMATVVSIVFQKGMAASNLQVPRTKVTFGFLWKIFGTSRMLRKLVCNKILKNLKLEILKTKKCLLHIQLATSVCTACTAARRCAMCGSRTIPVVAPATAPGRSPALRCQRPDATRPW